MKGIVLRLCAMMITLCFCVGGFASALPAAAIDLWDVNEDGVENITDVTLLLDALSNGAGGGSLSLDRYDLNMDGVVNVSDVTALLGCMTGGCTHEHRQLYKAVAPTCTKPGAEPYMVCPQCGEVLQPEEAIPALGHRFEGEVCTRCGVPRYSEGLEYRQKSGGVYVAGIGSCTDTNLIIPAEYDGQPVVAIGSSAFQNNTALTSVFFPDCLSEVAPFAFDGCSYIKSVTVGSGMTNIYMCAFSGCDRLTDAYYNGRQDQWDRLDIERGNECLTEARLTCNIKAEPPAFPTTESEGLEYEQGSNGLTVIGIGSFTGAELVIPSKHNGLPVVAIDETAFVRCTNLTCVVIPDSVTLVGSGAFYNCIYLTKVKIGNGVREIGQGAFSDCYNLETVLIGSGLETIESGVFDTCYQLSMVFYDGTDRQWSLVSIDWSRNDCLARAALIFLHDEDEPEPDPGSRGLAFEEKGDGWYVEGIGSCTDSEIVIPTTHNGEKVVGINGFAFERCTSITSIVVPDGVRVIRCYAFEGCTNLTTVYISGKISYIDYGVFEGCVNLSTIYFSGTGEKWDQSVIWLLNECAEEATVVFNYCSALISPPASFPSEPSRGLIIEERAGEYCVTDVGRCLDSVIVIPSTCNGQPVTTIGSGAFENCEDLTGVYIPDSVRYIDDNAFHGCTALTKAWIGDGTVYISPDAFKDCDHLKDLYVGRNVSWILDGAFAGCSALSEFRYGGTRKQWRQIELTVEGNPELSSAEILYESAYVSSEWPAQAAASEGLTYGRQNGYLCVSGIGTCTDTDIVIPATHNGEEVIGIMADAFRDCGDLTSVVCSEGLGFIGERAFYDCEKLQSVALPSSIAFIETAAFYGCDALASVYYNAPAGMWYKVGIGVLNDCLAETAVGSFEQVYPLGASKGLEYGWHNDGLIIRGIGSCTDRDLVIPSYCHGANVTSIEYFAFYECASIRSVKIPDTVTEIGFCAFCHCTSLNSVTVGSGVEKIDSQTFAECAMLNRVTLSAGVSEIKDGAFCKCVRLETINIPLGVTKIGDEAFAGCKALTALTLPDTVTEIGRSAFQSCRTMQMTSLPSRLTSIGDFAFYECNKIRIASLPDSLTSIGSWAFAYCFSLTDLTIPGSVTTISPAAFYNCNGLKSVEIQYGTTSIGDSAFSVCALTSVTIPGSVTLIDNGAFIFCWDLKTVTIGNGVITIGAKAFKECGLTTLTIPDSVTSIGEEAFRECKSLTSLTLGSGLTTIESWAFAECESITSLTIPNSVTAIGEAAFYKCKKLKNLTIGNGLASIGDHVFRECESLTSVTIPNNVVSIGKSAFYKCGNLKYVTVGIGVTSIQEYAFGSCTRIEKVYYRGTSSQWSRISIESGNSYLKNASRTYNYTG